HVVDREQHRLRYRQGAQQLQHSQPYRELIVRRGRQRAAQQGPVEGGPQVGRKRTRLLVEYAAEQVDQRQVGELGLGFGGGRAQDERRRGVGGDRVEQGRLADAGRAVEQHAGAAGQPQLRVGEQV